MIELVISHLGNIGTFAVLYVFAIHLALVVWVARDISHRSHSTFFQIFSVALAALLPFLGLFLYLILRPEKSFLDIFHEELERKKFEEKNKT